MKQFKNKEKDIILKSKTGKIELFYLLRDFQTQASLIRKVCSEGEGIFSTVRYHFEMLEDICQDVQEKAVLSEVIYKKKNVFGIDTQIGYKRKHPGARMTIRDFLGIFTKYKFSIKSLNLLDIMLYPRAMRHNIFNEESIEIFNQNLPELLIKFLTKDFILESFCKLIDLDAPGYQNYKYSAFNFNDKTNKELSIKDIAIASKDIFLNKANDSFHITPDVYLASFVDEEFMLDLIKILNNPILIELLREKINNERLSDESKLDREVKKHINFKLAPPENYQEKAPDSAIGVSTLKNTEKQERILISKIKSKIKEGKFKDSKLEEIFSRMDKIAYLDEKLSDLLSTIREKEKRNVTDIKGEDFVPKAEKRRLKKNYMFFDVDFIDSYLWNK